MADERFTYQELQDQILELKKQNEALKLHSFIQKEKKREYYYTSILNNIGDPVFVKDEQSRLLIVNDAFCELFHLERDQIIGRTLAEDVSHEERESFLKIDKKVLEDGKENINEESLTVRGGQTQTISTKKTRFLDADEKKYLVGVIHDITERKKIENSLKEVIATKDKLFSIIAHDLRSPFNCIIGFSDLIIENNSDMESKDSEQYIKIINSAARNTLILLDNLLNWAKSQTGQLNFKPEKILFSEVAQEIITLNKGIAKTKNISLDYFCDDNLEIVVDVNMLNTILLNLLSNAIKFTKIGGHIKVQAILKQNHVEVTISDDGIGIDEEKRKNLFNISSNTSTLGTENENGSGLGLVLCKEFVHKNNGEIWVESEENKGSSFIFTLPINTN